MSTASGATLQIWPRRLQSDTAHSICAPQVDWEYQQFFAPVRRYAYTFLRDLAEAEDVAQECFVRLIQSLRRGVAVERPLPWLLRVAHHLSLDALARRPREVEIGVDALESILDPVPGPEAALLEQDRRQRVQTALSRLSPQELRCWTLRAEGLRYREIAEILGIQTGTVSAFLVRATEKLSSISSGLP